MSFAAGKSDFSLYRLFKVIELCNHVLYNYFYTISWRRRKGSSVRAAQYLGVPPSLKPTSSAAEMCYENLDARILCLIDRYIVVSPIARIIDVLSLRPVMLCRLSVVIRVMH